MTLTIHTAEDDERQLALTVEVPEERVEKAMRQAARKLSRDVHFPGFRRGKAPYRVILRRVGRDALRADVIEELLQPVLEEAVELAEADVYGPPSLDDLETEPLVYKFTVPLSPEVELGAYREIRREIEPVEITDEAVDEAMQRVRERHQIVEEVDRAAQLGDIVTIRGKGELVSAPVAADNSEVTDAIEEGEESDESEPGNGVLFDEESVDLILDPDRLFVGTSFAEELVGLTAGDSKSFVLEFPADHEDEELAGRSASFDVSILNVKSRELPELDDSLAKEEGDFDSVDELRSTVRENLIEQAKSAAKNELIERMIDDLLEDATLVYPPAAVELEIDGMVRNFKDQVTRSGWEWADYLKIQGETEEQVRENFRENAIEALRRRLALRQFILEERLTVEDADVDEAVGLRVSRFEDNKELQESMSNYYRSGYGFDMLSSEILMDKVHQRITAILTGTAPDLAELTEEALEEEE